MMQTTFCTLCMQEIAQEGSNEHRCIPHVVDFQEVLVDHQSNCGLDENGDTVWLGFGLNGTLYRIRECPHRPIHPINTSDDSLQGGGTVVKFTEPHVEEMTDPMTGFFLLMGLAIGGYVMGWLSFRRPP